ncbi:hypothetical protein CYLTODRAFT_253396 [Cylindrobasidium torrendii FP15055 ss-10]|uniref:Uncharacterized protein n=1 Tax=Cylindrobasidium torrendii FP15055 ss-10 TaxID=1314674 RepID=A0A0D7ARY4_9AGAR|nr:hypothetical protein CYLTODRAFT_253396 [Cylindrobasidium torrendii FP15055 ss-10]
MCLFLILPTVPTRPHFLLSFPHSSGTYLGPPRRRSQSPASVSCLLQTPSLPQPKRHKCVLACTPLSGTYWAPKTPKERNRNGLGLNGVCMGTKTSSWTQE